MYPLLVIFLCCCSMRALFAQTYDYQVDLNNINKDQLTVHLKVPDLNQKTLLFQFPSIVPGTYAIGDYGRFIVKFEARDKNGDKLKVSHPNLNTWKIKNAEDLAEISYKVNDTWDTHVVLEIMGSNLDDSVCVFNNHCFFGYFEGYQELPFRIKIDRPSYFYGGTSLNRVGGDEDTDIFETASYFQLADNPILYARPDTATFQVGNTSFLIHLYSQTGSNTAKSLTLDIQQVVEAQNNYLDNELPLGKYAFLIFMIEEGTSYKAAWGISALEHTHSSFYCLKEGNWEGLRPSIRDIVAHEFFHTRTPLSIRSKEIHSFDYNNPKMSKHLWLYEGGTEYASTHYQVQANILTLEEYLAALSEYFRNSTYYDTSIPLTTVSEQCVSGLEKEYGNFYEKGALVNLCLDLKLRLVSNGSYSFQQMMKDLSKKYNADQPFDDEELFDEISALSQHPKEIRAFFKDHVENSAPLPLRKLLYEVGISFQKSAIVKEVSFFGFNPNKGLLFQEEQGKLELQEKGMDSFGKRIMGFQQGDLLYKWQGKELELKTLKKIFKDYEATAKAGDLLEVVVLRKNKQGTYVEVPLSGRLVAVETEIENGFIVDPNATPQQINKRNAWLNNY